MSVKKKGVRPDISKVLRPGSNRNDRFIDNLEQLSDIVTVLKENNYRIVLTQGVYDLIHEGHAKYLEMAKSYGDILIVGIDSDKLTKLRKGDSRPVVPENERIEMLAHLRHVDLIFMREAQPNLEDVLKVIKPDVLVVSNSTKDFDWLNDTLKKYCKRVIELTPQSTTSTSARVRQLTIEGAEKLADEINILTQNFLKKIRKI